MTDTQRILDVLESNGLPLTRRELLRLAGESGIALAGLGLLAGAEPAPAAAQAGGTMRIHMATDIQQLDPHLVTAWNDYCPWESIFSSLTALDRDFQPMPDLAAVLDPARPEDLRLPAPEGRALPQRARDEGRRRQVLPRADPEPRRAEQVVHAASSTWTGRGARRLPGAARPQAAVGAVPGQPRLRDDRGQGERREDRPRADRDGALPLRGARAELAPAGPPLGQVLRARPAQGGRDPLGARGRAGDPRRQPQDRHRRHHQRGSPRDAARAARHARASRSTSRRRPRPTPSSCSSTPRRSTTRRSARRWPCWSTARRSTASVFFGVGTTAQGCNPFPVGHWAHADVDCPKYDPDGAKKLLAEAGFPHGLELEWKVMNFPQTDQDRRDLQGDVPARAASTSSSPSSSSPPGSSRSTATSSSSSGRRRSCGRPTRTAWW